MAPRRKKSIPFRNQNHTDWWVASYLERFEYYDEDKMNLNRRCLAYENTILLRASDREEAYKKALERGRVLHGSEARDFDSGRRGTWRFEGLTSLLPVYDEIEDGTEIIWRKHEGRTVRKIKQLVLRKRELEVFDDAED